MTLKHSLFTAALTVSALFTFAAAGQLSTTPVNARRVRWSRRYHRHYRVRRHRNRRSRHSSNRGNKYGYWKHYWKHGRRHSYFYKYKSGYYHYGHWVSYHSHRRARRHHSSDTEGILTPDEIESPQQSSNDTRDNEIAYQAQQKVNDLEAENQQPTHSANTEDQSEDTDSQPVNYDQSNRQVPYENNWEAEMSARTIQDINNDREANGAQPLTESSALDDVAQAMAETNPDSHYTADGQVRNAIVAHRLGQNVDSDGYGENLENGQMNIARAVHMDSKNTPESIGAADWSENDLMNNDAGSNNGHRYNILDPNYRTVGVGVHTYTDNTGSKLFSLAEEFYF